MTFRPDPQSAEITTAVLASASDDGKTGLPTVRDFGQVFPVLSRKATNYSLHFVALPKPGASIAGMPLAYTPGSYTVAYIPTEGAHRLLAGVALEENGIGDYVRRLHYCWEQKTLRLLRQKSYRDPIFVTSELITNAVPSTANGPR